MNTPADDGLGQGETLAISINGTFVTLNAYQASFIAESLIQGEVGWDFTAVDLARRHMRHPESIYGYDGEAQAAGEARRIANAHGRLAVALLHAADQGNSHYKCDPATCEKQRERLANLAGRLNPPKPPDDPVPILPP